MSDYRYGAIWLINFEPQVGAEIKKRCDPASSEGARERAPRYRPGLIISRTEFNQKRQKITVLPFTTKISQSQGAARIFVAKSSINGLSKDSELVTIDPATFDKQRLIKYLGTLEDELLLLVKHKLSLYLNLI